MTNFFQPKMLTIYNEMKEVIKNPENAIECTMLK